MLVYDQQQPVRSEIRSFLQFIPLGGARWDISRYPLNIFNSAKRSPRGGLRFPLLNVPNGHRQLYQPMAWKWWKKWGIWENQVISRNLTWISTTKTKKSKKNYLWSIFCKKFEQKRSTELGERWFQNTSTCWGGVPTNGPKLHWKIRLQLRLATHVLEWY